MWTVDRTAGGNDDAPLDLLGDVDGPAVDTRRVRPHVGLSGMVFFLSVVA